MGTPTGDELIKFGDISLTAGITKVGEAKHACFNLKKIVDTQTADKTPDHVKGKEFDFKLYCDQANSFLTWKNTALVASAAVLMQSSLIWSIHKSL